MSTSTSPATTSSVYLRQIVAPKKGVEEGSAGVPVESSSMMSTRLRGFPQSQPPPPSLSDDKDDIRDTVHDSSGAAGRQAVEEGNLAEDLSASSASSNPAAEASYDEADAEMAFADCDGFEEQGVNGVDASMATDGDGGVDGVSDPNPMGEARPGQVSSVAIDRGAKRQKGAAAAARSSSLTIRAPQNESLPAPAASPLGPVVEPGQEHTGRWTKEEHELFLAALKQYGKEWKKVAARVKTRTVVQTRTHAQKYFQKLQKAFNSGDDSALGGEIDMEVKVDLVGGLGQKANAFKGAARQAASGTTAGTAKTGYGRRSSASSKSKAAAAAAAAAAPETAAMPSEVEAAAPLQPMPSLETPSLSATMSTPAYLSTSQSMFTSPAHVLKDAAAQQKDKMRHAVHTTGTDRYGTMGGAVKIVVPTPDQINSGMPPPSPAACGKRKLAEIAAAQMLAGVMMSGGGAPSAEREVAPKYDAKAAMDDRYDRATMEMAGRDTPPPVDPKALAPVDKTPKPQTESEANATSDAFNEGRQSGGGEKFQTPCSSPYKPPAGFAPALQIVNPESLGVSVSGKQWRSASGGGASPTTPWEGQLKALVNEAKSKEASAAAFVAEQNDTGEASGDGGGKDPAMAGDDEEESLLPYHPLYPIPSRYGIGETRSSLHEAVCRGNPDEVATILSQPEETSILEGFPALPFSNQQHADHELGSLHPRPAVSSANDGISGKNILSKQGSIDFGPLHSRRDPQGFAPLHSAACLDVSEVGAGHPAEVTRLLLSAGADVRCVDRCGNTALHWAARAGNGDVAHLLTLRNCPLDAQNEKGETALHWAMRAGRKGQSAVRVLIEDGARNYVFSKAFRRPLDVAAAGFDFDKKKVKGTKAARTKSIEADDLEEIRECRANLLATCPNSRTLVLHHPECLEHIPKSDADWECPDRITSILSKLTETRAESEASGEKEFRFSPREITVSTDFDKASLELISRVHSAEYLSFVNDLSKTLERMGKEDSSNASGSSTSVPFTPHVQRTVMKGKVKESSHSDTSFSTGSLRAARRAAGAVQHAVDRVLSGRSRNAFCVVRPPGHHAGVNGLLENSESCGFCIFNNVAAGAMHALSERHQSRCGRVAIVDIDVHHGNGTEEIVRRAHDPTRLFFFSVHLYDNASAASSGKYDKTSGATPSWHFYPGTGDKDDVAHNIINVPIAPLWKAKEVLAATSGSGSNVNPGSGPVVSSYNTRPRNRQKPSVAALLRKESNVSKDETASRGAKSSDAETDVTSDDTSSRKSTSPSPQAPAPPAYYLLGTGQRAYRRAIRSRLLPALRAFNPDLIIISAGFDASRGDVGNAKHMAGGKEKAGLDLDPEDYAWTTRKIMEIADICCQGRVISVLEGGYGRSPRGDRGASGGGTGGGKNVKLLDKSVFSESAMRHLRALIDPYDAERRHPRRELESDDDEE